MAPKDKDDPTSDPLPGARVSERFDDDDAVNGETTKRPGKTSTSAKTGDPSRRKGDQPPGSSRGGAAPNGRES
jgi:hypothetical protein